MGVCVLIADLSIVINVRRNYLMVMNIKVVNVNVISITLGFESLERKKEG